MNEDTVAKNVSFSFTCPAPESRQNLAVKKIAGLGALIRIEEVVAICIVPVDRRVAEPSENAQFVRREDVGAGLPDEVVAVMPTQGPQGSLAFLPSFFRVDLGDFFGVVDL